MDPFCRRVLAKHWPNATQYEDVKNIDAAVVSPVDILTGGFPCTDISVAGSRKGLSGKQSGLWHEYARIIHDLRPRFVFVENVPALRSFTSDDGLGRVLGDLAESGYDAEWDCVPAASIGASHVRDRIFILAWQRTLADGDTSPERNQDAGGGEREREEVLAQGLGHPFPPPPNSPDWPSYLERHPKAQPGIRRNAEGTLHGLDKNRRKRLKALGNAVVPQAAATAWELLFKRSGATV